MRTLFSFALAMLFATLAPPVLAAEPIHWPIPWVVGQQLSYQTEHLDSTTAPGVREKVRTTDTTQLTITQASVDGFVQQWRSSGTAMDVLEGDKAEAAMILAAAQAFEGFPLLVELDREANYLRLRNIDAISALARSTFEPLMMAGVEAGLRRELGDAYEAKAEVATAAAAENLAGMLDRLTSPVVLEAMLGQVIQTYNAFVGIELEAGRQYALEAELDNPLGGSRFPAKLQFHGYVSQDDPDDVFIEWGSTIDPVKGLQATWELVESMFGVQIPADQRGSLPTQISIVDEGFVLFHRQTGVIEMFETTRTTRLGERLNVSRNRMRLADSEHDHAWSAEAVTGLEVAATP